jgi:hypothetical protein
VFLVFLVVPMSRPCAAQEANLFEEVEVPETFQPGTENELLELLDDNPLNPLEGSLDALVQTEINEDLWLSMLGDLPCLSATNECVAQLQDLAIQNHRSLKVITERIELVNQSIDDARGRNQRSINLGTFTPLIRSYVTLTNETVQVVERNILTGTPQIVNRQQQVGFFQRIARAISNPLGAINEVLSLIGVPLFEQRLNIDANAQAREIAISDLQIKIAQIEQEKQKIEDTLAEQVVLQVIDFDRYRRDFQISQEVAKRSLIGLQLLKVDYVFGDSNTQSYLNQLSAIDGQKAAAYRAWAQIRSQLARIKILCLGTEPF